LIIVIIGNDTVRDVARKVTAGQALNGQNHWPALIHFEHMRSKPCTLPGILACFDQYLKDKKVRQTLSDCRIKRAFLPPVQCLYYLGLPPAEGVKKRLNYLLFKEILSRNMFITLCYYQGLARSY
tara:strand:+ start:40888 stop:41262 length:375 start_codon:yes stop_codon:yes gene_type:complete